MPQRPHDHHSADSGPPGHEHPAGTEHSAGGGRSTLDHPAGTGHSPETDRPTHEHEPGHVHDDAGAHGHQHGVRPGEAEWDARYSEGERGLWSGDPNHALVLEASGLPVGRALDVGCGEGADAVWLARQGWAVTGLDPSGVALARARSAAEAAGVEVEWVQGQLAEAAARLPESAFDLVSAFYPTLFHDTEPLATLTGLVAPGGSLLLVHHADVDPEQARAHGFDPAELLSPADVVAGVPDGWSVAVDERRPRVISGGAGAHHADDLVARITRPA